MNISVFSIKVVGYCYIYHAESIEVKNIWGSLSTNFRNKSIRIVRL